MALTQEEAEYIRDVLLPKFREDIPYFAQFVFGTTLRPKQIEFVNAFKNNRRVTFKGGVGFGKTHALAILVWWSLVTMDEVQVTIFGPNEGQLKSGIWKELHILHGRMSRYFVDAFDATATKIERKTKPADCFAEFRLANKDNTSSARGIHQTNNYVFVDEATGIADEVFTDALVNVLRDKGGKLCLISNPSSTSGYFWRTWNDPKLSTIWTKVHGRMIDDPNVTEAELLEAAIEYGGTGSRLYRIMVEGEFPLSDVDGLIPRDVVERAIDNEDAIPASNVPVIWGLDPAGQGGDRSVLIKRHDNKVIEIPKEWRGLDPMQLAYAVRDEYYKLPKNKRPMFVCVDAIGLGNGVAAALKEMEVPVQNVIVNNSPTRKREFYTALRDQLWWECRDWFVEGNVSIPNHPDLINELCLPTYDTDKGRVKVEDKKSLRKRARISPDYADALCLTFAVSSQRYNSKFGNWSKPIEYGDLRMFE